MVQDVRDLKEELRRAVEQAVALLGVEEPVEVALQPTPPDRPGDYGTPVAFTLARALRRPPVEIARDLAARVPLPPGVVRAEPVGGYVNFLLEPAHLVRAATEPLRPPPLLGRRVLVEHTSVNPNKELHVGHLRNVALGDALSRILRYAGYEVQVLNYIDDTGRQVAETLFALEHYGLEYDGRTKYDHWVGEAYVRLHREMEDPAARAKLEEGVRAVLHRLESGQLRGEVERILRAQLQTMWRLGAEYDALVWESDLVREGLLQQALALLEHTPYVQRPQEGRYAGALVMDTSPFVEGLEDPYLVLVRSDGTATYPAKDIAFQFWKMGLLQGLGFRAFTRQPSGRVLYTSHPEGDRSARFGGCEETINVIDVTQSYPQRVVRAALAVAGRPDLAEGAYHLAYETVTLEGRRISGRRGHTVSVDEVLDEACRRARQVVAEKNPDHPDPDAAAQAVGIGAVRFAMVKTEPRRQIDFRWEQALSFDGDSGPYVQYAHARAASLLRRAQDAGLQDEEPDLTQVTEFERPVARALLDFPEAVRAAAAQRTPHVLAQYLLELAAVWNAYYNARNPDGSSATPVLQAPPGLRGTRLSLVRQVREVLRTGLELLGVPAPEVM
ncbi:MAG: arginine--tRNA ligase [Armatimonadota bacterium]|nr:arginine--tRNA ligase [Armatimonadota bacterium]MDW8156679.1 arginine--tRNA ligase [Armatimonadota bacterium]